MNNNALSIALFLIFSISIVSLSGCVNDLPPNKYVVIEETVTDSGRLIEGKYPGVPPSAQPPVLFDINNPAINSPFSYTDINESFKALYGLRSHVHSPEGIRTSLNMREIYNYPYKLESGAIIQSIDDNGNIHLIYNNETINLQSGDTWKCPVTLTRIELVNYTNYSYVAQFNTTYEVKNRGIFEKAALIDKINKSKG